MKKISIVATLFAAVLAFALAGCSGGTASQAGDVEGSWVLEDASSVGFDAFLQFNDDGVVQYAVADSWIEGTWDNQDGALSAVFADQPVKLSVNGDKLTLGSSGASQLVFKRADESTTLDAFLAANGASSDTGIVEEQIEDIDPVTVVDDDTCSIVVTGKGTDFVADPGYRLAITNKSDEAIYISTMEKFKVGDVELDAGIGEIIEPGATVDAFMYFSKDELGGGAEKLAGVSGTLIAYDDKSGEELSSYEFHMD